MWSGLASSVEFHGDPLATGSYHGYQLMKGLGLFYVVLSSALFVLVTIFLLPTVFSRPPSEQSTAPVVAMAYMGLVGLFIAFSWMASRQRVVIYRDGFVPRDRRLREFAMRKNVFVPYADVYHVIFFTDLEKRNMRWARVYGRDGRWYDFDVGDIGGEVLVALNRVARGTAVPGLSLSREYHVSPTKKSDYKFHETVKHGIRSGLAPPQQGFM
jgi:hypothetical protein